MTEHLKGCSCFLRAYACAGIVDKPAKKPKKPEACTCAPCCNCGYDGQDSDGADCYGKKGRNVIKGGFRFYGPHCFCWHASEADCPEHGSPEAGEALADLEPCPNSPFRIAAKGDPAPWLNACPHGVAAISCGDCSSASEAEPEWSPCHDGGCGRCPSCKKGRSD